MIEKEELPRSYEVVVNHGSQLRMNWYHLRSLQPKDFYCNQTTGEFLEYSKSNEDNVNIS